MTHAQLYRDAVREVANILVSAVLAPTKDDTDKYVVISTYMGVAVGRIFGETTKTVLEEARKEGDTILEGLVGKVERSKAARYN